MRTLTVHEVERLEFLTAKGIEVALLEPTPTGLLKSIMDATQSLRHFLKSKQIHNYDAQIQGPENKSIISAHLVTATTISTSTASLYRPRTKNGDPRIWFTGLSSFCSPHDILGIAIFEHELWVINITQLDLIKGEFVSGPFQEFLHSYVKEYTYTAAELLQKIKLIAAKGFIPTDVNGDTAIGRLLETELGIHMNSHKIPDYQGIEIKSSRSERDNRRTLFAQVADWEISKFKSSREILENFGYDRSGILKLYCTINALGYNSQGLMLHINSREDLLVEQSSDTTIGAFAVWKMNTLRNRLLEKHAETFWVQAESKHSNGQEYLRFTKVEHTKGPLVTQFDTLILEGQITMDHLIKRKGTQVTEKGPLFKLKHNSLNLLFPTSKVYSLQE